MGWNNVSVSVHTSPKLDATCAAAVEMAYVAAREVGGDAVGAHVGIRAEAERVVTHTFAADLPGYVGWYWAVSVARASRAKVATVDEVVLLPGGDALLAPPWLPWSERLRPGDLAPGDVLPTPAADDRLVPGYTASGDESVDASAIDAVATELFLGRPRVLSPVGRDEAGERWAEGVHGATARMATNAPARCATCGFLIPLAGSLRGAFGVCANEFAPADGQVVTLDYGCGAHSEAVVTPSEPLGGVVFDDESIEVTP
jgi:hypothetical protein